MSASTTAWLLLTVAVLASVTQNIAEGRGRCTFANTYGHQCETSKDCKSSAECSGGPNHSCCHVRECGRQQCTDVSEPPTYRRCSLLENPGYQCLAFINQCRTSADCSDRPGHYCCPGDCGRVCKDVSKAALTDPSYCFAFCDRCTFANTYGHQCDTSKDCRSSAECSGGPNHSCCHVRECGRQQCTDVSEPPTDRRCSLLKNPGYQCFGFINQCRTSADCSDRPGHSCCPGDCGRVCKDVSKTALTDPRCTFANTYGHQCDTSKDCRSSAECSGGHNHACCHVRECGRQQCTDVSEPPTDRRCSLLKNPGYQCLAFINQCRTSADCSDRPGHSCCPGDCGRVCKDVSKTALTDPRCTFANTYGHQCETSKDCRRSAQCSGGPNHSCCHVRECGRQQCTDVSEPPTDRRCPESWVYGIRCSDYIDECKSIVDCRHKPGTNCCLVSGCGHKCKDISRYTTNPINVPQPVPFRG